MPEGPIAHPDLTFLKEHKLISDNLITKLTIDRRLFSQNDTNEEIDKEEWLKQIRIELNLLEIFKLEINKELNPNVQLDIRETENILATMANRIDHLYLSMFKIFSIECVPLVDYVTFQENNKRYTTNKIHDLMTKKNSPPELYLAAATLQYKNRNIEGARFFFAEGIKNHKNVKVLYLEELWVEVQYLEDTNGESFETAKQIYKNTIEYFIDDMDFHFMLLEKSIQLKSIRKLQFTIISDLVEKYKHSSVMWHRIANLCYEGFVYVHDTHLFDYTENFEYRAKCCTHSYQLGLKNVSIYKDKRDLLTMLTEYIVELWKCSRSQRNTLDNFVKKAMERAFRMGHVEFRGLHKPEYYVYWATHRYEVRHEILKLAIDKNKNNVYVWSEMLRFHMKHYDYGKMVRKIFKAGVLALENKSLTLWEIVEPYWNNNNVKQLEKLYIKGANSPYEEINSVYGAKYLRWYTMHNEKVTTQKHLVNVNFIRNLHNVVCMASAVGNICLWIDYIRFEFKNGSIENAHRVYNIAMKIQVQPFTKKVLRQEFDLLKEDYERRTRKSDPVAAIDLQTTNSNYLEK